MRIKKSFKNVVFNIFQQIISIITNFLLTPLIIKTFGSSINGLLSTIRQLMNYTQLTGAGIAATSTYALYTPIVKKEYKNLSGIYNATNRLFIKAGNIFSLILLLIAFIYPFFVNDNIDKVTVSILIVIIGICGSSEFYIIGKYQALLNADQKNYIIALAQSVGNILNIIIAILLIKLNQNIIIVQLGASIIYMARIFIILQYVKRNYKFLDKKEKPLYNKINQRRDAIIHEITALIVNASSVILISLMLGLKSASVYSIYLLIFSGLNTICAIISNSIYASFGDVIARKEIKILKKAYNIYELCYFIFTSVIFTIAFLMIMPFISLYTADMTDVNYYIPLLGYLLAIVGFFNNIKIPARTLVIANGDFKQTKNNSLIEMIINIVSQIILIPIFGIIGAPLGCLISSLYRAVDFIIYTNTKILNEKNNRSLKRTIMCMILSIASIKIIKLVFNYSISNYKQWIRSGIINAASVILIFLIFIFIFESDTMKETIYVFKQIFKLKTK